MASKTLITPEEYLRMSFDGPEPDYVDGELRHRHVGSTPHMKAQKRLLVFFDSLQQSHSLFSYPEATLRTSPKHYRVADVAVFRGEPQSKYPSEPIPFVIEIVSEDDRWTDIQEKLAEYHCWGVAHVWLVDPWTRRLHVCDENGVREVKALEAKEFGIRLTPAEIFADYTPQQ
jgi:Uma2 family endonuclease